MMTKYPPKPDPFNCAICGKLTAPGQWDRRESYPMPPLCRTCEHGGDCYKGAYGYGPRFPETLVPDKRVLNQLRALVEEIQFEGSRHGRA